MTGIVWPSGGKDIPRVTSEFNPARRNPVTGIVQPHNGIDLIGFTYNRAPEDGRVTVAGYNGGAGIEVRIVADGPTAFHRGTTYRILHNAPNSLRVSVGDRVTAGQIVGTMGTTGQSTGIHCHFETHPGSSWDPTNPRDYMAAALVSPAIDHARMRRQKEDTMYVRGASNPDVYATSTDANGNLRVRLAKKAEAAYAGAGGLVIFGDDATLTMLGIEGQYMKPYSPNVDAKIDFTPAQLAEIASHIEPGMNADKVKAAVAEGMAAVVGSIGFTPKP